MVCSFQHNCVGSRVLSSQNKVLLSLLFIECIDPDLDSIKLKLTISLTFSSMFSLNISNQDTRFKHLILIKVSKLTHL